MVSPSLLSSEIELATVIVFTGFACLRNNPEQNLSNALVALHRLLQGSVVRFRRTRSGSGCVGQVDALWEQELNLYDIAAGALIARQVRP
ncbi:FIG domain-containing protein [Methylobacter luteus]|uniref:hypothetical protein n=1 Tax=Methylobacter luteus TaxID=415 RepID=UPI001E4A9682|nr:hypothetical protein [Methylobacter luteus]